MLLVTGGSGFIGSHTVRALADRGEPSVLLQRSSADVPPHLADLPVVAAQGDVADLDALRAVADHGPVTGIVHLAGFPSPRAAAPGLEPTEDLLRGFLNVVRVAREWDVRRVTMASTIGVYGGIEHAGPLREDLPLHLSAPHPIPRWKKISELLAEQAVEATGLDIVTVRISGTWGPAGHEDPFFAAPALVHAAASGDAVDTSRMIGQPRLGDGLDLCYVKDTARAIALLQLADSLRHRTYNVGTGRVTTNAEIIAAIRTVEPDFDVEMPEGSAHPANALDITRLREDTGYRPEFDTRAAAADYLAWLRAGNER
ncbi:NAD(P)-dependent oxidoreductase [Cellulomonas sp. H30R-01]|uniref:NAD-dependent epimerase/dehydratase family protein n=1 Tax=Cellulomonas sp. H30R-01 TaxID=2704467 RepID=UPI00138BDA40|nr:NAD(P)-dependent oxidoreductase [Cellulomonas sp. H30R-01]QHT56516.1 NAD(P)-dependent oxidoreductase [Cellulomonas sp. H30R-01]